MKFIILILFLLLVTSTFSNPLFKRYSEENIKKSNGNKTNSIHMKRSEEDKCKKEFSGYEDCYPNNERLKKNYLQLCPIIKSEKCQKAYEHPELIFPSCQK